MKKRNIKLFESYNNQHNRVIPRDFFNEAKLLKCMGVLALSVLDNTMPDGIDILIEESGQPFDIVLDEMWGLLIVSNYRVSINDEEYMVGTTYNSKEAFPFVVVVEDTEYEVFNEQGKFSHEFIELFNK